MLAAISRLVWTSIVLQDNYSMLSYIKFKLKWEGKWTSAKKQSRLINQLPEELVREVNDFVSFLLTKRDRDRWQLWVQFTEGIELAESDFSDYLSNLQAYEEGLACGKVKW